MQPFKSNFMKSHSAQPMRSWLFILPILLLVALCVPFLNNPLVFDDIYFFSPGGPERFLDGGFYLASRWWVDMTHALTFVLFGPEMRWLRLGNLAIHIGVAITLFAFIRRLILDIDGASSSSLQPEVVAVIAATLFAFHPLANFTQGYLIQRTTLCATLFSLLSWLLFWQGLKGSHIALWGSCLSFALSVFAKEHAIMAPFVCVLLLALYMRSGMKLQSKLPAVLLTLFIQALIALYVFFTVKKIFGSAYEPLIGEMLDENVGIPTHALYSLSVLNQAGLFFKYLLFWVLPNPAYISLDMREAFPTNYESWKLWCGALLYLAYGATATLLLFRGKVIGLAGLAMLSPWLLYFTELATVRLQEPFVLYRSYLWMPLLFVILALGARRLKNKLIYVLFPTFLTFFAALTFDRLVLLSHPFLVWDEAVLLFEEKLHKDGRTKDEIILGGYRLYYNRGTTLLNQGMLDKAAEDFDRALTLNPNYQAAYHQKGVIHIEKKEWHLARVNFERALKLKSNIKSWLGRGRVLEETGDKEQARISFIAACSLGSKTGCNKAGININEIKNAKGNKPAPQNEKRPG